MAVVAATVIATMPVTAAVRLTTPHDPFFTYTRPANYTSVKVAARVPWHGGSLDCMLWRPGRGAIPAAGRFPGVFTDYQAYAAVNAASRLINANDGLVTRGYSVLQCNPPGAGTSTGPLDPLSPTEQQASYDAVEWLGTQSWSDGNVGMQGASYGAHSALELAVRMPPHLRTIIPLSGISDWYLNTIYHGGIPSPTIWEWELAEVPALAAGSTNPLLPIQEINNTFLSYRQHPLHDDFWVTHGCISCAYSRLRIPVLELDGWNDRYKDGMIQNYLARKRNITLVLGPWGHASTSGSTAAGTLNQAGIELAWYDHYLQHRPSAPLPRSAVTAFEMPEAKGTGWHQFDTWPPAGVEQVRMFLKADHTLARVPGGASVHSYVDNGVDSGCDPSSSAACSPNQAQADLSPYRSVYTSAPLAQDMVVAGSVEADILAAFPSDDPHLVIRLGDVDGNTVTQIAGGWRRVNLRGSFAHALQVIPETSYHVPVHVYPQFYRFLRGHRLRISVSSGDFTDAAPDNGVGKSVRVHVGSNGSYLTIPVMSGSSTLR